MSIDLERLRLSTMLPKHFENLNKEKTDGG